MTLSICKQCLLISITLGSLGLSGVAQATTTDELHENLLRAVCLNDWEGAIALVNPLIAIPDLTSSYRQSLVTLRDQLTEFAKVGTVIPEIEHCGVVLQRYVPASEVSGRSPDWPVAITSVLGTQILSSPFNNQGSQIAGETISNSDAVDSDTANTDSLLALSPAVWVDMETGSAVSAGIADSYPYIHAFLGGLGDLVTLDVDVTRMLPGAMMQTDNIQLFLFDATGTLIADNDNDGESLQSQLEDFQLPQTGRYYVAVTTYDNAPILDDADRILGWPLTGSGAVEYTLTIRGVTPSADLIQTNYRLD
ncbi:MAG: hypothetical protein F6K42_04570 [Leptolyngbya sp. SIO1D8]|nr:hypothetical protein [Leptolyngbya sp. SIO1D8]